MINYKTITDTGPYSFSGFVVNRQQNFLHGPTATLSNSQPPGGPPTPKCSEQSPPAFFEQGIRTRWLLLYNVLSRHLHQVRSYTILRQLRRFLSSPFSLSGNHRKAFKRLTTYREHSTATIPGNLNKTSFLSLAFNLRAPPEAAALSFPFPSQQNQIINQTQNQINYDKQ